MNAEATSPSAVASSRVRKPDGLVSASRACSMSATPSRPSTVLRFQVKETRSRQKQSTANIATTRSTSRTANAASKSANHASTRACGVMAAEAGFSIVSVM